MNHKAALSMDYKSTMGNLAGWLFGGLVLTIGVINTFWGNDTLFGIFLALLSFVYYPPVNRLVKKVVGFSIPLVVKIVLGIFIIWAALGVGELFNKIQLMMGS
jgi:hypothetical protein